MTTSAIPPVANIQTHSVFSKLMSISSRVFSNQTSRFPHTSSCGTKYVVIFYDYDSHAILAEPIKSRSERDLTRAFAKLNQHLTDPELKPFLQILDNECPQGLKRCPGFAGLL